MVLGRLHYDSRKRIILDSSKFRLLHYGSRVYGKKKSLSNI